MKIFLTLILLVSLSVAHGAEYLIFSGNSSSALAREIASCLQTELSEAKVSRFNDGEIQIQINENVRNKDVFVIQSTCSTEKASVNDHVMELFLMTRALKRASANSVTAIIPYYGYGRQDRKVAPRVPISASDVAMMLEDGGVDRVVSVDLHCGQIQGFFRNAPVDNLYSSKVFARHIAELNLQNPVVVSPDAGGVERAKQFKEQLTKEGVETDFAIIIKQRASPGVIASINLIGDVQDKDAIIVDDICDTGGTIVAAASELKKFGARNVYACITHPVFSNRAIDKIAGSCFTQMIVTNSIPINEKLPENITQISIAPMLADVIERISEGHSVSIGF